MSPEAARITTVADAAVARSRGPTRRTNKAAVRSGDCAGASPDTITSPRTSRAVPIFELGGRIRSSSAAATSRIARLVVQQLRRPPAVADLQGLDELRDRQPQREGRHSDAARAFHAQRQQRRAPADRYYTDRRASPPFVTIQSPLAGWTSRLNYNLGIYAQDSWTLRRLTLAAASGSTSRTSRSTPFTAGRDRGCRTGTSTIPEIKNVPNWKDVNPRIGVSLRPVRQRQDGHQGEREPQRPAGLDWHCARQQPGVTIVDATGRAPGPTSTTNCVPDCDLTQSGTFERRDLRPVAQRQLRQRRASARVRLPGDSATGGASGRTTGSTPPACSSELIAAPLGQRRLLPPHRRQLLGHRQRGS